MFDTVCTYPLISDVFAQTVHPKSPLLALGLATGHVQVHRLPPCHHLSDGSSSDGGGGGGSSSSSSSPQQAGQGTIETIWRTRRHKGSCRCLSFSADGAFLFSAGSDDWLVKAAVTDTGRVVSKIAVPLHRCVDQFILFNGCSLICGLDDESHHMISATEGEDLFLISRNNKYGMRSF